MTFEDLFDLTLYGSVYLLFATAVFFVEGADRFLPDHVNTCFKRVVSRFLSFFKGFIGAGGWAYKPLKPLGCGPFYGAQFHDGASFVMPGFSTR